ncbi:PQQ-binding-like beta-propeller repeat protein [Natrinema sp. CGMCC1.2065]|uniref:outer membrane protein assembly factor BamB family protein n=1 Tax=Natrinema sp. CGMCC1.2065 TaxID=3445767 RepID=UPI003F49CC99
MDKQPSRRHNSRREYLLAVGTAGLASIAGCSSNTSSDNNDPSDDSTPNDVDAGTQQWTFEPEKSKAQGLTVADGMVYVSAGSGSRDNEHGAVHAIDATTGDQQWTFETDKFIDVSPKVANGTVYIAEHPPDTTLYALDAASGDQQWSTEPNGDDNSPSSLTITDNTLYFNTGFYTYALDATSGEEQWKFDMTSGASAAPKAPPQVSNGTVYVGKKALDATSGDLQWESDIDGRIESKPAVADGSVYLTTWGKKVHALNAASGDQQWEFDTERIMNLPATVANGTVYAGPNGEKLHALDATSGERQWSRKSHFSIPAVGDESIYVGGGEVDDGYFYSLSAADGSPNWELSSDKRVTVPPQLDDNTVYFGTFSGTVYAVSR